MTGPAVLYVPFAGCPSNFNGFTTAGLTGASGTLAICTLVALTGKIFDACESYTVMAIYSHSPNRCMTKTIFLITSPF